MGYYKNLSIEEHYFAMLAEQKEKAEALSENYIQAANDCLASDDYEGYEYYTRRASEVLQEVK